MKKTILDYLIKKEKGYAFKFPWSKKQHAKYHWDEIKKIYTTIGNKCEHSDILNIKKINGENKWIEVGYCIICNNFVYVTSPEDTWHKLKI